MKFSIIRGKKPINRIRYDITADGKRMKGTTEFLVHKNFVAISKNDERKTIPLILKETIPKGYKQEIKDLKEDLEKFEDFVDFTLVKLKRQNISDITKSLQLEIDIYFKRLEKQQKKKHVPLFEFIQEYIDKVEEDNINPKGYLKPVGNSTVTKYKKFLRYFKEYRSDRGIRLEYEDIDEDFYIDYVNFFRQYKWRKNGVPKVGFANTTIGEYVKQLKKFMGLALAKNHHNNNEYKTFIVINEKKTQSWLTSLELDELLQEKSIFDKSGWGRLDVSNHHRTNQLLDYFLLLSYTGMRVGDMLKLRKDNVIEYKGIPMISFYEKKVKKDRVFRITDKMQIVLDRWEGGFPNDILRRKVVIDHINKYLDANVSRFKKPHFEDEIRCHTARRSYCTNELIAGTDVETIKTQSGHKSDATFRGYIMDSGKEVLAELLIREGK